MRKVFIYSCLGSALLTIAPAAEGAGPPPSAIVSDAPACKLLQAHELETYIGMPAIVRESSGTDASAGLCSWAGSTKGATVDVMLFPAASAEVPEDAERTHFDRMIETQKQKYQLGEFVAVPELADDAWVLDLTDNPTQYFVVYLFKGKDSATVATKEIGLEATVAIARKVAERMP